jgi:hypothetical protein
MQNFLRYCELCEARETPRVLVRKQPRARGARWISFGVEGACREKRPEFGSDSIKTDQAPDLASCLAVRPLTGQATSIFETELQESASGPLAEPRCSFEGCIER